MFQNGLFFTPANQVIPDSGLKMLQFRPADATVRAQKPRRLAGQKVARVAMVGILNGSPSRTRTYDLAINSRVLYQLSYRGMALRERFKANQPWPQVAASGSVCMTKASGLHARPGVVDMAG